MEKEIHRTTVLDTDEALTVAVVNHRQSPLINDQLMVPKAPYERKARGWRPSLRLLNTTR
jgi:hypothetical protein